MISSILAISDNNAIGMNNFLPWPRLTDDMQWFRKNTEGQIVIMGKNTWDSLGIHKPLKNRINFVVSSKMNSLDDVRIIKENINEEIQQIEKSYPNKEIFIMGGKKLYEKTWSIVDRFYITRIRNAYSGDTFLDIDIILENSKLIYSEHLDETYTRPSLDFQIWSRV